MKEKMAKHGGDSRAQIEEKQEMAKDEKPYIVLLTDTFNRKLNKSEWAYIEELFRKHSWLARIECPARVYSEME